MELLPLLFMCFCFMTLSGLTFGDGPGAAKPHVTSHDQIIGRALLQCDVKNAYPEPKVEWRDSDNEIIHSKEQVSEQGGRFNITLKATVTKTGRYRCVATQKEINHQAQKEIHVHLNVLSVWAAMLIGIGVGVIIVGGILLARCCCKKC